MGRSGCWRVVQECEHVARGGDTFDAFVQGSMCESQKNVCSMIVDDVL